MIFRGCGKVDLLAGWQGVTRRGAQSDWAGGVRAGPGRAGNGGSYAADALGGAGVASRRFRMPTTVFTRFVK